MQRWRAPKRCRARPNSISATPPSSRRSTASSATARLRIGQFVQAGTQLMSVVPVGRRLCGGELQGNPAHRRARGPGGRDRRRHVPRPSRAWPRRQHRAGQRPGIRAAAAGQRHRQFHQGGAAHSRSRSRSTSDNSSPVELRPGMSVIPTIETQIAKPACARPLAASPSIKHGFRRIVSCQVQRLRPRSQRFPLRPRHRSAQPPIPTAPASTVWIAVLAAMIGSFMAILNIQITNASLLNIEGGIGTGVDNGSWISTSYLIGEIVVIPLTDYLSRVFSFRRYMLASAALVRGLLGRLRLHPRSAVDDRDARPAGLCRRRADPDGVHAGADQAAEAAAADRACDLRAVGHLRARDRARPSAAISPRITAGRPSSSST